MPFSSRTRRDWLDFLDTFFLMKTKIKQTNNRPAHPPQLSNSVFLRKYSRICHGTCNEMKVSITNLSLLYGNSCRFKLESTNIHNSCFHLALSIFPGKERCSTGSTIHKLTVFKHFWFLLPHRSWESLDFSINLLGFLAHTVLSIGSSLVCCASWRLTVYAPYLCKVSFTLCYGPALVLQFLPKST